MIDLDSALTTLGLTSEEACSLLDVSERTFRRWRDDDVPATAEAALRAWLKLHEWGIPWRPDTVSVVEDDRDQIRRIREHNVDLDAMLQRVEARGGPAEPWTVDFRRKVAVFGPFRVTFYTLANGGFSLSMYSRKDERPDAVRDAEKIEDAAYWIASAYRGNDRKARALQAVADYTRTNSHVYVRNGARMHLPEERAAHIQSINDIADALEALAADIENVPEARAEFQERLDHLHKLGFFPAMELVSAAAHAFMRDE